MTNQWTSTEIARLENRRFMWRDAKLVVLPLAPVWSAIALLGLSVGLAWRVLPQAAPPNLYALLDLCGLVLWLAGWRVAEALTDALRRRRLHLLNDDESLQRMLFLGLALGGCALALALAPAGLLLAYSPHAILQTLSTQDIAQINVSVGAIFAGALVLGGSLCVVASCFTALCLRGLGKFAPLAWFVVSAYVHLSTVGGLSEYIRRFDAGGYSIFSWVPPTLGVLVRNTMAKLADPQIRYEYANPLTDVSVAGAILAGWLLIILSLWIGNKVSARRGRTEPLPIAAVGAVVCMAVYVVAQQWVYVNNAGVAAPGSWTTVLALGPLACVVLNWMFSTKAKIATRGSLLWILAVIASSVALTTPQLRAGQGSQLEVLWQALLLMGPFLLVMQKLDSTRADRQLGPQAWPLIFFASLLVPIDSRDSVLDLIRQWALAGTNGYIAAGMVLLLLLLAASRYVQPRRLTQRGPGLRPAV